MKNGRERTDEKRKPGWLKKTLPRGDGVARVERILSDHSLNTVCSGARCPNRCDCFQKGTATFLIMGAVCTRSCRFCSIPGSSPAPLDPQEPERLARAAAEMKLRYVVVTSVTRDDLPDGGASHFAATVAALGKSLPGVPVELLVPDFGGDARALQKVLEAQPAVLNHNVETVPSLYARVRPGADYARSLALLARASMGGGMPVKSGFMLGLGEAEHEVESLLGDLRRSGVDLVTIGQYLKPARECLDVVEYVTPERFEAAARMAKTMGFAGVAAGPFVRSSFQAAELAAAIAAAGTGRIGEERQ
jgi:lipoic acid synthetase